MKKNKLLVIVTTDTIVKKSKESNITFLFPVKDFCVGFPKTFEIEEIPENGYLFINRMLDKKGIEKFKELMKILPDHIKGIVFDDIGILNILKENKKLKKILFLNHMNCNSSSINCYLEYVDSVVISTDITKKETKAILKNSKKPLVVFLFGHVNIMYSRRTLLSNYNNYFHENIKRIEDLTEEMSNHKVKAIENKYGTVIYTNEPFNNLDLRNEEMEYGLVNTVFLSDEEVLEVIKSNDSLKEKYSYQYLSQEETIFKLKEEKK